MVSVAVVALAFASSCTRLGALPQTPGLRVESASSEEAAIERQEICIGSSVVSAGELADTLYYRSVRTPEGKLAVGYFAFFSEERPWGNNWLTWTVLPALVVEMVYSRALLVAPGVQRAMYGKGDVEGARIYYDVAADGTLSVDHAVADDGTHRDVVLSRGDLFSVDPARPVLYSDVWSHQLGGKGARSKDDLAYLRCYKDAQIRPLPDAVALEFNADGEGRGRAVPAHVEAMGDGRSPVIGARRKVAHTGPIMRAQVAPFP